ncbi:jg4103 [Pararge aegeria aegeria]|uniref:Jg4103 protein n=1 Tax=Pararge aegeria aegeria TaxID=348720 RepID=A0A8S4RUK3_9NEOP|nr:jg4103 [Pararge aegeria aegeria]
MMLVRLNMRLALAALCGGVLLVTLYWGRCGDLTRRPISSVLSNALSERAGDEIECWINGEYSVACLRDRDQVYVPFSFIHKYFEIYGKITSVDGVEKFEWSHSYSKVYHPKKKYDPRGTFATFENYNVEVRDRVKCISGIEGVPVSTQWEPKGFFYPTQIAQFGLAHYSKNITEPEPRVKIIDDGEKYRENWIVSKDAVTTREFDSELKANVLRFSTTDHVSSQVWLKVNISQDFVLSMDLMLKPNSSMTVVLQNKEKKETVYLHYVTSTQLIYAQEDHIYYGIGVDQKWRRLTRDLIIDMQKGHSAMSQGHAISVLSRAFYRSGDAGYLRAAQRALYLLDVPSHAGGVKAMWMDKYLWYEEYPTKPPLFVLNGFIYTLLGLYDLHVIEGENSISLAKKMFDDGMVSLKALLPLFDTGSGSFYDLRHFTLGVSPNIARWDYHATHVNQLYLLSGLDPDPILINTAKRWEGYMQGKRAAHN